MSNYREPSIEQALKDHDFSHKFYVKYAVACAKYAISFVKEPDPRTLIAIDLT